MFFNNYQEFLNAAAVCNRDFYNVACFLNDHPNFANLDRRSK